MKAFDCVAMKRAGAARVQRATKGMSFQQVVAYWKHQTDALLKEQEAIRSKRAK